MAKSVRDQRNSQDTGDSGRKVGEEHVYSESEKSTAQEIVDEILEGLPQWIREPLSKNFRQILASIACVLLITALWSGYTNFVERGENAASAVLGRAIHTADTKDRIEVLKEVVEKHGHTDAARHALLLLGAAYMNSGDRAGAAKYFSEAEQIFPKGSILHDSALMGMGYCAEEANKLSDAVGSFASVADNALGYEKIALLDLARVSAEAGKDKDALSAYEKFMAAAPMSPQLDFVRFEIMKISEKMGQKTAGKGDK